MDDRNTVLLLGLLLLIYRNDRYTFLALLKDASMSITEKLERVPLPVTLTRGPEIYMMLSNLALTVTGRETSGVLREDMSVVLRSLCQFLGMETAPGSEKPRIITVGEEPQMIWPASARTPLERMDSFYLWHERATNYSGLRTPLTEIIASVIHPRVATA